MKSLSFTKNDAAFVSEAFAGGVVIQVANDSGRVVRVGIETCINPEMGWCNTKSVMLDNHTVVFSISDYGKDQLFRLRASTEIKAVTTSIATSDGGASSEAVAALASRVAELEDGQEPLVLDVNEDGDLTQTGAASGDFGVDNDGNLTFTDKE